MVDPRSADTAEEADAVLERWWNAFQRDPFVAELVPLVPADRRITLAEGFVLVPMLLPRLSYPGDQLELIAACVRAYAAATGCEITPREER